MCTIYNIQEPVKGQGLSSQRVQKFTSISMCSLPNAQLSLPNPSVCYLAVINCTKGANLRSTIVILVLRERAMTILTRSAFELHFTTYLQMSGNARIITLNHRLARTVRLASNTKIIGEVCA